MVKRDRGQIMLIGAVAIAFIFLGLAAVYTAQLSARPATTGSVGDQGADATEFNREARRNVRAIAVRVNHAEPYYASRGALNDSVARETTNYSRLLAETYAGGTGSMVDVRYDGATRVGTRTTLYDDGLLTDDANATTWRPVEDPADVGWFVLNLNVTAMSEGDPFVVRIENATGADTTYTFTRNTTGQSVLTVEVTSETEIFGQGGTCNPRGNRSVIDLTSGESFTSTCSVEPAIEDLDGPYTVEFENADNAAGKFSVVTDTREANRANGLGACPPTGSDPQPCNTYAAWNVTLTTRYDSGELSYTNTQNVTVYEGV
ncbi:DUF7261 family protein [Haloplanus halophilus]|uniref:DUF7261 family protein n=1 Tax=Haloplanus halophilus TaxID=2949993 RepID=UPI00203A4DD6|nr:hypothetical protein [Haloplanus sp. GDY1]